MKYALLFGINYKRSPQARLRGCINDVNNMAEYLRKDLKYDHVKVYTDENNIHETGIQNIIHKIYKLAILSHRQKINQVYLHFSGHGTSTFDKNRDEKDGKMKLLYQVIINIEVSFQMIFSKEYSKFSMKIQR